MNSSLSLSNFQINDHSSPYFDTTLGGIDQNGKKIDVLHVFVREENGIQVPSITELSKGQSYRLSECNSHMIPDFKTLLEKNLILLYNFDKMEMLAFSGFEKYGKINKHAEFCCFKLFDRSYSSIQYRDNKIPLTSYKMMDKKTSDCIKKNLMDIAWWFDKAPNETSKRQYEVIPRNQLSNKIQQSSQPIFSQISSIPSRSKALPLVPTKLPINSTPSIANSTKSSTPTSSFNSLADFQGNNFDKDTKAPPEQHLKTAIDLAKKEGYTKFEITNSFCEKSTEVYAEPYIDSVTKEKCHKAKVNFFIDASNDFGKNCRLILQRQFFFYSPDAQTSLKKIAKASNKIQESVVIGGSNKFKDGSG